LITVVIESAGKRFESDWIFRNISIRAEAGSCIAITGSNGSGKSTLLQLISGHLALSEGKISLIDGPVSINKENWFRHIAIAAPYLDLPEDLSPLEIFGFQKVFKSFLPEISAEEFLRITGLEQNKNKALRHFSSGMKQRMKLGLCLLSGASLLLLDEPVSNLDQEGIRWYRELIAEYRRGRSVWICSNAVKDETFFCTQELNISDYKDIVRE
jgi:ABC-type multidrug transport system ATPase subunit